MTDIKPFRIEIEEDRLDDLRRRIERMRWPHELPGVGWSRGVPLGYLRDLAEYWAAGFDWRAEEARLNALPQFTTEIDRQRIHFIHARSPEPNALPLIITHGYPSSIAEFADVIGPLTDPGAHGSDAADAFHVVAASLPGFAFSTPVGEAGWAVGRTGRAFAELMRRLGYERYGAQGGDIGAGVSGALGAIDPAHVVGVHLNTDPMAVNWLLDRVPVDLSTLSESDRQSLDATRARGADGKAYLELQSTRPQTIGYALNDSPIGLLAWIAEKFEEWSDLAGRRARSGVDRDRLLGNVSIYWFTQSGPSAAQFLYEAAHSSQAWGAPSSVPQGWALFAAQAFVRKLLDRDGKIAHWSEFDEGGHFAALETPELLVGDIRKFFRPLR
jgi:pimeloyl-ACP methyl ester carboxylesterase